MVNDFCDWTIDEWNRSKIAYSTYWGNSEWPSPLGIPYSVDKICNLIDKLSQEFNEPIRIADIGCGKNGILGKEMVNRGISEDVHFFEYVDVDIIGLSGANSHVGDFKQNLNKLPYKFHFSFGINSLLLDPFDVCGAMRCVSDKLVSGGSIIATAPSVETSKSVFDRYHYEDGKMAYLEFNENSRIYDTVGIPRWRQWLISDENLNEIAYSNGLEVIKHDPLPVTVLGIPKLIDVLHEDDADKYQTMYTMSKRIQNSGNFEELPKVECYQLKKL